MSFASLNINEKLIWVLGLLGLLPFAGALVAELAGARPLGIPPTHAFIAYSAVILSFLSGSLWAKARIFQNEQSFLVLIASNILALLAFLCLLFDTVFLAILLLTVAFGLALFIEKRSGGSSPAHYLKMRTWLTWAVMLMHAAMLLADATLIS